MFSTIWDFKDFFYGGTFNIFQTNKPDDVLYFGLVYGFQLIKCQISIFTSFYVLYLMRAPNMKKIVDKEKAYELRVYKTISVLVAIIDVI